MEKKSFLVLFLILFTTVAAGQYYDGEHTLSIKEGGSVSPSDGKITYGDDVFIEATCDPETGTCLAAGGGTSSREIQVSCEQENVKIGLSGEYVANDLVDVTGGRLSSIPSELHCGLGEQEIKLIDPPTDEVLVSKTFEVHSDKSNPNKGYYIVTRFGLEQEKVEDFFLTNTPWYDCDGGCGLLDFNEFPERGGSDGDQSSGPRPIEKGAFFLVSERDGGLAVDKSDEGIVIAEYGEIITGWGDSLADYEWGKYYEPSEGWACGFTGAQSSQSECKEDVKGVLDLGFDENYGKDYDQKCSVAQNNYFWSDCSPLHDNGKYKPQGEVIIASEPDKENFQDITEYPHAIDPDTYFFVCRGDYKGSEIPDSKLVKVQENVAPAPAVEWDWQYYRCNQQNDWEEVECEPGTSLELTDEGYECVLEDPVTVEVDFFDLKNVPISLTESELIAGFRIKEEEVQKYEQVMGKELKNIDAECWMGDDDQRPSSESDAGVFSVEYSGFGDAWVLGSIPFRESVSNSTYSCLWGFSEDAEYTSAGIPTLLDHGIYESTRQAPLRSVDAGRVDMDYEEDVKSEYSFLKSGGRVDESLDRDGAWLTYSSGDTRSYVTSTTEDMFSYSNAYPYCSTPQSPDTVLENVICEPGSGPGPVSFSLNTTTPDKGGTVEVDASGTTVPDGAITSYSWNFGDGETGSGAVATNEYSSTGNYEIELTVESSAGETYTATRQLEVTDSGDSGKFEIAYLPAHFQDSDDDGTDYNQIVDEAHSLLSSELPVDSSKVERTVVEPSQCNMDCNIIEGNQCIDEVDQCVGPSKPIQESDYNKVHVICDNEDDGTFNGDCGGDGQPNAGGVAYVGGEKASSVFYGDITGTAETVAHEIGHNLDLRHLFNEAMLKSGWSFGDTYDPGNEDPTVPSCSIPAQYKDDAGGGMKEITTSSDSPFVNEQDNDDGETTQDYFLTYCSPRIMYGPAGQNHMENNQLSMYQ